ncbi:hypothetical protein LguiB_007205 [Lonicera macranthoides]
MPQLFDGTLHCSFPPPYEYSPAISHYNPHVSGKFPSPTALDSGQYLHTSLSSDSPIDSYLISSVACFHLCE